MYRTIGMDARAGVWPDRYTTSMRVIALTSVHLNEAVADVLPPPTWLLFPGAWFRNELTGLPVEPTTYGYSVQTLFREAGSDSPFGMELSDLVAQKATDHESPAE